MVKDFCDEKTSQRQACKKYRQNGGNAVSVCSENKSQFAGPCYFVDERRKTAEEKQKIDQHAISMQLFSNKFNWNFT